MPPTGPEDGVREGPWILLFNGLVCTSATQAVMISIVMPHASTPLRFPLCIEHDIGTYEHFRRWPEAADGLTLRWAGSPFDMKE